jgi:hypothetical protein
MTPEQKYDVQFGLDWATNHIQAIEQGPEPFTEQQRLIECQLLLLLHDVVHALPQAMREQAQACIQARERVQHAKFAQWKQEDDAWKARQAARQAQKETSPECLQAVDSL